VICARLLPVVGGNSERVGFQLVRKGAAACALATALGLGGGGVASAAVTRYAAPGGTADDTVCTSPTAAPCNINDAAAGPDVASGDEAVIAPGEYSDSAGDLGPNNFVDTQSSKATNVHGVAGKPRPKITLTTASTATGAFSVSSGVTVSHLEIDTAVNSRNITIAEGTIDDVIARSSASGAFVCQHTRGTIRDSACLSSGTGATAVGTSIGIFPGTFTSSLRNVTAVATGSASFGLYYKASNTGVTWVVSAKSVIAQGGTDVKGECADGASTAVNLDHSNYDSTGTACPGGGTATVTPAGAGTADANQTAAPMLAADGFHQLAGSVTIDTGATDATSGSADIDGNTRTLGTAADIGADELAHPTTTAPACSPPSLVIGMGQTTCTATVTDTATSGATSPTGDVFFSSDGSGGFSNGGSCTLTPLAGTSTSSCAVLYTPAAIGSGTHQITAQYLADATHEPSEGSSSVAVAPPPPPPPPPDMTPPNTALGSAKIRRAARKAKFTFSSNEAGSSFLCKIDKKAFAACTSPKTYRKLKRGKHKFQAQAIDAAGNRDSTPVVKKFKI
jgi:hypothetical protein